MTLINVAVIEPVGSHGGMDYYDSGLCGALAASGVATAWYTCDTSVRRGARPFNVFRTFEGIWGKSPLWRRGLQFVRGVFRTLIHARAQGSNVAHFHFFHVGVLETIGVILSRLYGFKVVATIHDVESFKPGRTFVKLRTLTYALCSHIVVHNRVSLDELTTRCSLPRDVVTVIPHGSYIGLMPPPMERDIARRKLTLPTDGKVVLFFGQIKEVKGLDILIAALAKAKTALGPVHLVIAGKVWKDEFSRYQKLIEALGLSDVCHLHIRYIADEEVPIFYGAADLIVLPYRRIYQSGVLLMAMSYGVPVLASDLQGMKEIIEDGKNGFLFRVEDDDHLGQQLIRALRDTTQYETKSLVARARQDMVTRFGWDAIASSTIDVYRKALAG